MVAAIEEITVNQGIDPRRAVLVAGGGAAGFNSAAIARRLGCPAALLPEIGAALSAGGALLSDLVFTDGLIRYVRSDAPDLAAVATALETLTASAEAFLAGPAAGPGEGRIDYWVEARYPQQTWEIEVPLPGPRLAGEADLALLVEAFHAAHQTLYAVSDPASPVELIAWRVRAARRLDHGAGARLAAEPAAAGRDTRRIHLPDAGWREVPLRRFDALPLGEPLAGPAIVESSFTTILVPPGSRATRLASGTLKLEG